MSCMTHHVNILPLNCVTCTQPMHTMQHHSKHCWCHRNQLLPHNIQASTSQHTNRAHAGNSCPNFSLHLSWQRSIHACTQGMLTAPLHPQPNCLLAGLPVLNIQHNPAMAGVSERQQQLGSIVQLTQLGHMMFAHQPHQLHLGSSRGANKTDTGMCTITATSAANSNHGPVLCDSQHLHACMCRLLVVYCC